MAIQKSYTSAHGVTVSSAYHRVKDIECKKENDGIFYCETHVNIHNSASDKDKLRLGVARFVFHLDVGGSSLNPVKQAYDYLKTQNNIQGIDYTTGTTDV